jgi:hypothetical protein
MIWPGVSTSAELQLRNSSQGVKWRVLHKSLGLSRRQQAANIETIQGAKKTLGDMATDDMTGLKRWFEDMSFMAEVLAYRQLAILRLRAARMLN